MSHYLSHLAALTLNQVKPIQPRLASRFEMPIERGNDVDTAQESGVAPPVHSQSAPVIMTDIPVAQKVVTPATEIQKEPSNQEPFRIIERTEFVIKKSESPSGEQPLSLAQNVAPIDIKQASRVTPLVSEIVRQQPSYSIPKDLPATENTRTIVERVQEHFTETTHNEFVIRELIAPLDAQQKSGRFEDPPRAASVKPTSTVVHSEQSIVERNTSNQATDQADKKINIETSLRPAPVKPVSIIVQAEHSTAASNIPNKAVPSAQFDTEATPPAPTIQVTIGRVEIRATQVSDKSAAKPCAVSTAMSLDDYLKQRSGGKS